MAYSTDNPPALISQRVGDDGVAVWIYKDGDDLGTIIANGYISDAAELGMKANDIIEHVDSTNNVVNRLIAASWTNGTASGAGCNAIEPVGETDIVVDTNGTGTIIVGDIIKFGNDPDNEYRVTTGDADVATGNDTIVITPGLVTATEVGTTINVQSDVINLKPSNTVGIKTLDAASTLTAGDSGTYVISSATEFATTLPSPLEGAYFKFIVGAAPSGASYTVTGGGGVIEGGAVVNGASVAAVNETTITFADGAAAVGDYVELVSDGTSWFVNGVGMAAASITFA
jgi:hypothetical protein